MLEYKRYTVHGSYSATGEGMTLMILYCLVESEEAALKRFKEVFGEFYSNFVDVEEEFNMTNTEAVFLLSEPAKKMLSKPAGSVEYHSSIHVNFS